MVEGNEQNLEEYWVSQVMGGGALKLVNSEEQPIKDGNCPLWVVRLGKRKFGQKPSQ